MNVSIKTLKELKKFMKKYKIPPYNCGKCNLEYYSGFFRLNTDDNSINMLVTDKCECGTKIKKGLRVL